MTEAASSNRVKFQSIFEQIEVGQSKTKIACTIGPASWDPEVLIKLIDSGMNIARLNFSHGDHEVSSSKTIDSSLAFSLIHLFQLFQTHQHVINNLKEALRQRPDKSVAVMMDTAGSEIRTGTNVGNEPIEIEAGQALEIITDYAIEGDSQRIACNYR